MRQLPPKKPLTFFEEIKISYGGKVNKNVRIPFSEWIRIMKLKEKFFNQISEN